jgi:beta-N-acetylhexosaminidase
LNIRRTSARIALLLTASLALPPAFAAPKPAAPSPVHLDRKGERWAAATLRKMSLEEKIGQMIMVWARVQFLNVRSPEYIQLREEMLKYHVGGFGVTVPTDGPYLYKSEPLEAAELTNSLQRDSRFPLLFAADFERGLAMRLNGATEFPAAMAFGAAGDPELARRFGEITALESRAVGIQWNWFPDADVDSNPANPIINTRSFGEDPKQVGDMVAAYIDGAHQAGMLTTVKHFPGHGDTDTDSHLALARVNAGLDRLNSLEFVPFRKAIAAGVDSVMIGHLTVPALEPDANRPASISSRVVTGLLREQLGFQGLIVTDALDMGALMHVFTGSDSAISGTEAVEAVRAGNDMVIIPADLDGAYNGLLTAVRHGEISEQRIDASVLRILRAKASVGLDRNRFIDLAAVTREVSRPESLAVAAEVATRAITLVSDENHLLPLRMPSATDAATASSSGIVAIVFTDDARRTEGGRAFARQLRLRAPGASVFYVDEENAAVRSPEVLAAISNSSTVIALAEAVPGARRTTANNKTGSVALNPAAAQLLADVVEKAANRSIFIAFGNPYTGDDLPGARTRLCTFSNSPASASSLAAALFGESAITGHLPITLPGIAAKGTGIERNATDTSKNTSR